MGGAEEGDFPATAGGVDHILWDGETGNVAVQGANELDAFFNGGAEVGGAVDGIALQEIVGFDVDFEKSVEKIGEGLEVVVDLAE